MEGDVMKHTQGPWVVDPDTKSKLKVVCNRPYGGIIAEATNWWVDTESAEANARLIAAAPDMLVAIKGAIAALTQNKTYPADIVAAVTWLKSAVSKMDTEIVTKLGKAEEELAELKQAYLEQQLEVIALRSELEISHPDPCDTEEAAEVRDCGDK
jgi:hypothetical protein